jgi:ribosomal protein S18 acetylase RimI-like enzyme
MRLESPFRPATAADAATIAQLFGISSDGVADYVWTTLAPQYPGLTPLEIGARRYAREDIAFSYKNCVVAQIEDRVVGMLHTFAIPEEPEPAVPTPEPAPEADVLAPYKRLELPGSWYISGVALFPGFRGRGLGTKFLSIARQQAQEQGLRALSLIVFEQNNGAVALYERNGFTVAARAPVVPHALIRCTGDALLMTAPA